MKVMIAAGGTGGHIYPATALAEVLKKEKPDSEIVFFGSSNRMESDLLPSLGYRFYGYEMSGTNGGIHAKIRSFRSIRHAYFYARSILKKEKPDICIGFGNYISVPLILAAHNLHIPTMIHEQNSFAGKANKFLARYVDGIASCYESNLEQMPKNKQRIIGNPSASLAADTTFDPGVLKELGLDPKIPFVVCMMGSLGSSSVSKVLDEACSLFDPSYQVIIASGKSNEYTFQFQGNERIKIVEFVNGKEMLKGCSLAVLRAGATTMSEITAIGCASILIPSPYVPNNHQFYNANELVKHEAAMMIEEKDLNAHILASAVNTLMKDDQARESMKKECFALGKRDAAEQLIVWMEELING